MRCLVPTLNGVIREHSIWEWRLLGHVSGLVVVVCYISNKQFETAIVDRSWIQFVFELRMK